VEGDRTGSQNRQSDHEQMRDGAEEGRAEESAKQGAEYEGLDAGHDDLLEMYYEAS
jgi:hypothetical protein